MSLRKCSRAGCNEQEFRIDGYCSIYCRDMDDLKTEKDEEIATLCTRVAELEAAHSAVVEKYNLACSANEELEAWAEKAEAVVLAADYYMHPMNRHDRSVRFDRLKAALSVYQQLESVEKLEVTAVRKLATEHAVLVAWAAKAEAVRVAAGLVSQVFQEMAPEDRFAPPRSEEKQRELLEWVRDHRDRLDAATWKLTHAFSSCPPLESVKNGGQV